MRIRTFWEVGRSWWVVWVFLGRASWVGWMRVVWGVKAKWDGRFLLGVKGMAVGFMVGVVVGDGEKRW